MDEGRQRGLAGGAAQRQGRERLQGAEPEQRGFWGTVGRDPRQELLQLAEKGGRLPSSSGGRSEKASLRPPAKLPKEKSASMENLASLPVSPQKSRSGTALRTRPGFPPIRRSFRRCSETRGNSSQEPTATRREAAPRRPCGAVLVPGAASAEILHVRSAFGVLPDRITYSVSAETHAVWGRNGDYATAGTIWSCFGAIGMLLTTCLPG